MGMTCLTRPMLCGPADRNPMARVSARQGEVPQIKHLVIVMTVIGNSWFPCDLCGHPKTSSLHWPFTYRWKRTCAQMATEP